MQYQYIIDPLTSANSTNGIKRTDDNGIISWVPNDSANCDWVAYQAWLAQGNTPQAPSYP